ncbi:DNA primase [Verrucomicrobia bacterium]|nr:DNA primase [Verrucomicrobiota bacterium]
MAGLFSASTIEQIRAGSDIVDVIGSYLPLKRAGANFVALCPFHREKTPSFSVNPHKQIFYCFGCHKGGDVFAFVKEHESIEFPEAVRRLAERAKIPLEYEQGAGAQQARHLKETLLEIHEQIAQRWQHALANEAAGEIARNYLASRGVAAEAIQVFRLGCAPDLWDDTVNWARSKSHDLVLVEKAGLILRKEGSDHYYDRFRGRLMFPICDEQGRVIGFSGRVLSGDEKTAKYVNSPETPIFTKSKVFFGLHKTKRAILDAGYAIVCEGQLDLIASFMAGVQNIVAPQGTALTADHARILRRYVEEVVLCFDSDEAGQNAAVRSLDHLLASGLAVRVAVVPAPHDPDSFIKASGGAAFRQLIEKAQGFFDYYLARLCAAHPVTTDKGRLAVLRSMAEAVNKTGNLVLIDTYAQKTALRLAVSPDSVRQEFKRQGRVRGATPPPLEAPSAPQKEVAPPARDESGLLQLLFQHEDLVEWAAGHLDVQWLEHPLVRKIVLDRLHAFQGNGWQGLPPFLDALTDPQARNLVTRAVFLNYMEGAGGPQPDPGTRDHLRGRAVPKPFEDLKGLVTRLRNKHLTTEINQLAAHMVSLDAGSPGQIETYRKIEALKALKRKPVEDPQR